MAPRVQFSHDANGLVASILTYFHTKPTILHLGHTLHDHLGMQPNTTTHYLFIYILTLNFNFSKF